MTDHSKMKLGKAAPRHDRRTLQLANYLRVQNLPPAPPQVNYGAKVNKWPMMANDQIGDCTCAAAGHLIEDWTANAGKFVIVPTAAVIEAYSAITGYDPKTGKNDNGAVEIDVLNYWRQTGVGGHEIVAYVALEPSNREHVRDACFLFGGCYIGLALPTSAQKQDVWSVPPGGATGAGAPGSWGGHAVPVVAYDSRGLTVVTWGALKVMTWEFWDAYCDEAYAVYSKDFLEPNDVAPNGFDMAALMNDLNLVKGQARPLSSVAGAPSGPPTSDIIGPQVVAVLANASGVQLDPADPNTSNQYLQQDLGMGPSDVQSLAAPFTKISTSYHGGLPVGLSDVESLKTVGDAVTLVTQRAQGKLSVTLTRKAVPGRPPVVRATKRARGGKP
jgi:hypothetical protein